MRFCIGRIASDCSRSDPKPSEHLYIRGCRRSRWSWWSGRGWRRRRHRSRGRRCACRPGIRPRNRRPAIDRRRAPMVAIRIAASRVAAAPLTMPLLPIMGHFGHGARRVFTHARRILIRCHATTCDDHERYDAERKTHLHDFSFRVFVPRFRKNPQPRRCSCDFFLRLMHALIFFPMTNI